MTTVADLIKYLETIPSDTIVEIVENNRCINLDLNIHPDFTDFHNNQFIDENHELYNKRFLVLGEY